MKLQTHKLFIPLPGRRCLLTLILLLGLGGTGAASFLENPTLAVAGYTLELFAAGLVEPTAMVVGPQGNLFVSETGAGRVSKVTPEGQVMPFLTGLFSGIDEFHPSGPFGLAFDARQQLYVAIGEPGFDQDDPSASKRARVVLRVDPRQIEESGVSLSERFDQVFTGFINPFGLAFSPDSSGVFYVSDGAANQIWRVAPGGEVSIFVTLDRLRAPEFGSSVRVDAVPTGLAFDEHGDLFVAEFTGLPFPAGVGRILKISTDPKGIAFVRGWIRGLTTPVAIAFSPSGELFVVEHGAFAAANPPFQPGSGRVLKVNAKTRTVTEIVTGLTQPAGIVFTLNGDFFISEMATGKLFRVSQTEDE